MCWTRSRMHRNSLGDPGKWDCEYSKWRAGRKRTCVSDLSNRAESIGEFFFQTTFRCSRFPKWSRFPLFLYHGYDTRYYIRPTDMNLKVRWRYNESKYQFSSFHLEVPSMCTHQSHVLLFDFLEEHAGILILPEIVKSISTPKKQQIESFTRPISPFFQLLLWNLWLIHNKQRLLLTEQSFGWIHSFRLVLLNSAKNLLNFGGPLGKSKEILIK